MPARKKNRVKLTRSRDPLPLEIKKTLSSSSIFRARTKFPSSLSLLVVCKSESSYRGGFSRGGYFAILFVKLVLMKWFAKWSSLKMTTYGNQVYSRIKVNFWGRCKEIKFIRYIFTSFLLISIWKTLLEEMKFFLAECFSQSVFQDEYFCF